MADKGALIAKHWDWYNGMWNDEYTGAFLYWRNVDIRSNTRALKLSKWWYLWWYVYRYGDNSPKSRIPFEDEWFYLWAGGYELSNDWWNQRSGIWWTYQQGGTLYRKTSPGSDWKLVLMWDRLVWFSPSWDAVTITTFHLDFEDRDLWGNRRSPSYYGYWILKDQEFVNNQDMSTWWTAWAWWTMSASGATHTSWTDSIKQSINFWGTWRVRCNVVIKDWTTGTLSIEYDWNSKICHKIHNNVENYTTFFDWKNLAKDFELVPSNDFDGTVKWVSCRQIDTTRVKTKTLAYVNPLGEFWGDIYVSRNSKVYTIDLDTADIVEKLAFPEWTEIVAITEIGNMMNIYANFQSKGIKYIRDGVSNFPDMKVKRSDRIYSVVNNINSDFVNVGYDIYISEWYSKVKIRDWRYNWYAPNPKSQLLVNRNYFENLLGMRDDLLEIEKYRWGILTYWSSTPWINPSLVEEYDFSTSWFNAQQKPGSFVEEPSSNPALWKRFYIDTETTAWYWFIITRPEIFRWLDEEKLLDKIKIWCMLPSPNCKIRVSAMINDDHYYTFYSTLSDFYEQPEVWAVYKYWNNSFRVIQSGINRITTVAEIKDTTTRAWVSIPLVAFVLNKESGVWQDVVSVNDRDNFCYIKEITTDKKRYLKEYIYSKDLIWIEAPNIYKISLKVELFSDETKMDNPELNTITFISTPDQDEF